MYTLSRLMLILTVIACCGCLVAVAVFSGGVGPHRHSHRSHRGRCPAAIRSVHRPRNRTMGDVERLAVCRNGWCQARADHRQDGE